MNDPASDVSALDSECRVFCRYLIGKEPNDYVRRKYRVAHETSSLVRGSSPSSDPMLVKIARGNPAATRVIDAYARVFRPSALVRKKLVLLVAILESCAPSHSDLDSPDSASIPWLFLKSIERSLTFALLVVVASVVILPLELAARGAAKLGRVPSVSAWTE